VVRAALRLVGLAGVALVVLYGAGRLAMAGRVPVLAPLACSANGGTWYGAPAPLVGVRAAGCYRVPR